MATVAIGHYILTLKDVYIYIHLCSQELTFTKINRYLHWGVHYIFLRRSVLIKNKVNISYTKVEESIIICK